jgi:3-dehydro-L-gulonate 2-dehydrogenase
VIAVPRAAGALVLDMAMSQFSYGALESYRKRGETLPMDGGFDAQGNLTRDPGAIEASERPLPVGYWKGSGLAVVLDALAAMLSLGQATHQIAPNPLRETGVSQVFVAIDPATVGAPAAGILDELVESLHRCAAAENGAMVRYPGERTLQLRKENRRLGLPVDEAVWAEIVAMV